MNDIILYFAIKYKNDYKLIMNAIKNNEKIDKNNEKEYLKILEQNGINFLTILDDNYPKNLYYLKEPLICLFYKGNINLLNTSNKIYIINEIWNTTTNKYLLNNYKTIINDAVITTCDYAKTERKIVDYFKNNKGRIIHFAQKGLDSYNFINFNSLNELVISIYPPNTHPKIRHFYETNNIASLISDKFLSFSMQKNSKTNNLINCFLNYGKEINCFPGVDIEDGNNQLIKSGAKLVTYISSILQV
ncbi:DNA processing protein [Mycoplasma sp. CSL10137]|uniref:DNA processing protein n=1 Tax=unclassified Mycoplasma TaxID=2683645 RepID=UPI00197B19D3|nr:MULTISPECIES: DNA processing protein [unclassified Mycoplasma]MBN4083430.1 DNA processing protein [Mycoplasma sp. CSL10137]MBN4084266.1 DNA processing protein [Mycoplasma sp. CSL10166]MBU4692725.1 DNA processing protein [Mycoplasma sp. CSL7491-lung]